MDARRGNFWASGSGFRWMKRDRLGAADLCVFVRGKPESALGLRVISRRRQWRGNRIWTAWREQARGVRRRLIAVRHSSDRTGAASPLVCSRQGGKRVGSGERKAAGGGGGAGHRLRGGAGPGGGGGAAADGLRRRHRGPPRPAGTPPRAPETKRASQLHVKLITLL